MEEDEASVVRGRLEAGGEVMLMGFELGLLFLESRANWG